MKSSLISRLKEVGAIEIGRAHVGLRGADVVCDHCGALELVLPCNIDKLQKRIAPFVKKHLACEAAWLNHRSTLRIGKFEARLVFEPKKGNGHRSTHPWKLSLYAMAGDKIRGCYGPLSINFKTEAEARAEGVAWIARRGASR